jgi:D-proline reductase (dithiol) PrdB
MLCPALGSAKRAYASLGKKNVGSGVSSRSSSVMHRVETQLAELNDFSLKHRLFLKSYPWRRIEPVPGSELKRPLSECRLAIVSTAGFVLPDQERFDPGIRGGDSSWRPISSDTQPASLVDTHRSETFDHQAMCRDPNLAFPIDRAHELVARGRIGSVNRQHLSFMGSITAPGRLIRDSAPAAARALQSDDVDIALLVPV